MATTNAPWLTAHYCNFKNDIKDLLEVTDFSILTWLAFGASLQQLSQSWLPPHLSYWLPLGYLVYRLGQALYDSTRIFSGTFTGVKLGRWKGVLPEPEGSAVTATNDGVVMFLLGVSEIDTVFKDMWKEALENRDRWSYLGKSATLFDISDTEGITTFYLSYWKDLKGLQEFATSAAHRVGMNGYNAKKFPWVGIMHETYHAPKGSWETIYHDMPALGLGAAKSVISSRADGFEFRETLVPNKEKSTMYSRMGREVVGDGKSGDIVI